VNTLLVVVIVIAALVVIAPVVGLMLYRQNRRSKELRQSFGPEYGKAVDERGDRREAESELDARRRRVEALQIHDLKPEDRDRLSAAWQDTQAQFVDDPENALRQADSLTAEAMQLRGYPLGDFDQRAADLSVEHPQAVTRYRKAHEVMTRLDSHEADTEDLRRAMTDYRELMNDLLGQNVSQTRRAG